MSPAYLLPAAIPGLAALSSGVARAAAGGLSFAATLADQMGGIAPTSTAPRTAGFATSLQDQLGQFASLLKERLASLGQSLSGPVELSANVLGETTAIGGQEDAQAVEGLLGEDAKLSSALHQLLAAFQSSTGDAAKVLVDEHGATLTSKY
jgi:hypothetical protein